MLRTRKTKVVSAALDRRRPRLGRHHEEARGVVRLVLDVPRQHVEPVDLAGELRGERRQRRVARPSPRPRPSRRCRRRPASRCRARAGRPGTGRAAPYGSSRCGRRRARAPGSASRLMCTRRKCSPMMCRPELRQQVVDVGDPPVGRVLDRQHRELGPALAHRGDRALEGDARHALPARGTPRRRPGASRPRAFPGTRSCRSCRPSSSTPALGGSRLAQLRRKGKRRGQASTIGVKPP